MANKVVKIMLLAVSVLVVESIIHYKSLIFYKLGKSFKWLFRLKKNKKTDGLLVQEIEAFRCPISHNICLLYTSPSPRDS